MIRMTCRWPCFRASVLMIAALACSEATPTESLDLTPSAARQTTSGPVVTSTVPASGARGTTLDVRILGSGFDAGSTAQWAIDGIPSGKVVVNSTSYVTSKELRANITIASDADVTFYDVIVTSKGGKPGIGTETFEVTIQMTDLGTLSGNSEAFAINESGQVAGYSGSKPFLWENGVMKELALPAGFTSGRAQGLNNLGHVVGQMNGASGTRAFLWTREGGMRPLAGSDNSNAYAINDNGIVAGYAKMADGTIRAAIWIEGLIQFLPPGAVVAYDVNSAGEVVGSGTPSVVVGGMTWGTAFMWSAAAGLRSVATLRGSAGEALGINDAGQVVGWGPHATDETIHHAFVSAAGTAVDLGIPGVSNSVVMKISSNGLKAGRSGASPATLWLTDGSMIDLRGPPGTFNPRAEDVNSAGAVAGIVHVMTRKGSSRRAVVWRVF